MTDNTEALPPLERAIDDYLDGYVLEGDDGYHMPTEHEKLIVKDAIMGLLEEPEFRAALTAAPSAQAEPLQLIPDSALVVARKTLEGKSGVDFLEGWVEFVAILGAAPPTAQAEPQVPLRGEQIVEMARQHAPRTVGMLDVPAWVVPFARAIERAHGIGKQEGA